MILKRIVIRMRRQQQQQMEHQRRPRGPMQTARASTTRFWDPPKATRPTLTGPMTGKAKTKIRIYFYNNNTSSCISINSTSSSWWTTHRTDLSHECISTSTWSSPIDISTQCRRFSNTLRRSWASVLRVNHQQVSRRRLRQPPPSSSPAISTSSSSITRSQRHRQTLPSRTKARPTAFWTKIAFVISYTSSSSTISFNKSSNSSK